MKDARARKRKSVLARALYAVSTHPKDIPFVIERAMSDTLNGHYTL